MYYSEEDHSKVKFLDFSPQPTSVQPSVAVGDLLQIAFTGWLVEDESASIGSVFETALSKEKFARFKPGRGSVIKVRRCCLSRVYLYHRPV